MSIRNKLQERTAALVTKELNTVISDLISLGLCVDQNFPATCTNSDGNIEINWSDAKNLSIVLKNISYLDIYEELNKDRNYSAKFIDGALLQMQYVVSGEEIISHRLAFFPAPNLESFQNDPEIYLKQDIYADILAKNIVPVPIRFDFSNDEEIYTELYHAKSHATFGQYKNCRIPVSGILTPYMFVDFILRNFYSNIHDKFEVRRTSDISLIRTISKAEERLIHFNFV